MANLTLNSLYTRVIAESAVSSTDYSTTLFLDDAHIIAQDIWSDVINVNKGNGNWDIWYTDTVSLQDEYNYPSVTSTTVWAEHIENISITYTSDTYTDTGNKVYYNCKQATPSQVANWEYYLEKQPTDSPIYFQRDKSIFIAPDPRSTEVWTNRIKITGIRSIDSGSWTTSTTEIQTKLPVFLLSVIVFWCIWKASVRDKRDRGLINDLKNEYLLEKRKAIAKLEDNTPNILEYPVEPSEDIIFQ
jgi:hypothetical protein